MWSLAEALQHMHRVGFVNGDVKPDSVLVALRDRERDRLSLLIDFGTCATVEAAATMLPTSGRWPTASNLGAYTPSYSSPE